MAAKTITPPPVLADIAIVGLAVMGENLALNMESRGHVVAVWNRSPDRVTQFLAGRGSGKKFIGCSSLEQMAASLKKPRKALLMVMAGAPVDDVIRTLVPLFSPGDVVIDGGNSHFPDTERRVKDLKEKGINYVGMGVSGGEEGALHGPSLMPGGATEAWPILQPILQSIAAVVPEDDSRCVAWIGEGGSGHYVKMVHNGIEYGDMQLICEAYSLLKTAARLTNDEISEVFQAWNAGDLSSYLIEITSAIMRTRDPEKPSVHMVDTILDSAEQKGTGKWTAEEALEANVPVTLIAEAVFARFLSALKKERLEAAQVYPPPPPITGVDKASFITNLQGALFAAKVVSYAQGFAMIRAAATQHKWKLNYGAIAMTWRGGCIIRSKFLGQIKNAFDKNPELSNLLLDPYFADKVKSAICGWRTIASTAVAAGIPCPALTSALSYFEGFRSAVLPANLLQAQRDYFGAHMFERVDNPGKKTHFDWTGHGGNTASTAYTV